MDTGFRARSCASKKCQGRHQSKERSESHARQTLSDAKPYDAPNHRGYSSLRLFGAEAGGTKGLVFGYSHFLPGGGAGPDASPPEKVYFVLSGELTVIVDGKETVLKANDSCVIEPNETREIINRGNEVCSIVVAVAMPPK